VTTRERNLTVILAGALGVGALGFLAYTIVISPWLEKGKQIESAKSDIDQRTFDLGVIIAAKKKFETSRQMSLPADVTKSRSQYSDLIQGLFRKAEFSPGTYSLEMKPPDSKSAPTLALKNAPKKPAYTKLNYYNVKASGELSSIIKFMKLFYEQPLLHSIKDFTIQRSTDSRNRNQNRLDLSMEIEAIVLENAPDRPTLLPTNRELALVSGVPALTAFNLTGLQSGRGALIPSTEILALHEELGTRDYSAMAGKNVFFGAQPKRKETSGQTEAVTTEQDISEFITLVSLTGHSEDGKDVAAFRDKYNNHNYTVTQNASGHITVEATYSLKGRNINMYKPGLEIIYGTEEGGNQRHWRVRKITSSEVILEKVDPKAVSTDAKSGSGKAEPLSIWGGGLGKFVSIPEGKIIRLRVGDSLDKASFLLTREAGQLIYTPRPTVPPETAVITVTPEKIVEDPGR
jgi:hypothetical protein